MGWPSIHKLILAAIFWTAVFQFWPSYAQVLSCQQLLDKLSQIHTSQLTFQKVYRPFFEPIVFIEETPYSKMIEHEIATALNYAKNLENQGLEFVLVSSYRGRNVPIFDGLVIDRISGQPLFNVSLKFASVRMRKMDGAVLLNSLIGRLDNSFERSRLGSPEKWRRLFGTEKETVTAEAKRAIDDLAKLFGLHWTNSNPFGRELRTVLDMSESGYSYDFVSDPKLQKEINELLRTSPFPETLTLIWNENQVLNFPF